MGLRTGSTAGISFIYCSNRLKKASEGFLEKGNTWRRYRAQEIPMDIN